jgi:uncharacterized protein (TIGR02246 family)
MEAEGNLNAASPAEGGPSAGPQAEFDPSAAPQAALRVLDAYRAAVHDRDLDAFAACYDRDVRVFDMWGAWSYEGIEAWRGMAREWFGSLGSERVAVEVDDVQVTAGTDLAVLSGFITYAGLSADGARLRAMQNRLTWTLALRDGTWRVIHEHSSAPADFATGKVTPQR